MKKTVLVFLLTALIVTSGSVVAQRSGTLLGPLRSDGPVFSDLNSLDGDWVLKRTVQYTGDRGWLNGYADGTFRPDNRITARQITKVIDRAYPDGLTRAEFAEFMKAGDDDLFGIPGTFDRPFWVGWKQTIGGWGVKVEGAHRNRDENTFQVDILVENAGEHPGAPVNMTMEVVGESELRFGGSGDGFWFVRESSRGWEEIDPNDWVTVVGLTSEFQLEPKGKVAGPITWDFCSTEDYGCIRPADFGSLKLLVEVDTSGFESDPRAYFALPAPGGDVTYTEQPSKFADPPPDRFPDAPSDNTQVANAIAYVASRGWLNGYADGTFRPDNRITAKQIAKVIDRAYPDGLTRAEFAEFMKASDDDLFGIPGTFDRPFWVGWKQTMGAGWSIKVEGNPRRVGNSFSVDISFENSEIPNLYGGVYVEAVGQESRSKVIRLLEGNEENFRESGGNVAGPVTWDFCEPLYREGCVSSNDLGSLSLFVTVHDPGNDAAPYYAYFALPPPFGMET